MTRSTGWRCLRCRKPYENGPDYGRFMGYCWPCVRAIKGLRGGGRRS
jgi:hypothetical protein